MLPPALLTVAGLLGPWVEDNGPLFHSSVAEGQIKQRMRHGRQPAGVGSNASHFRSYQPNDLGTIGIAKAMQASSRLRLHVTPHRAQIRRWSLPTFSVSTTSMPGSFRGKLQFPALDHEDLQRL